MNHSGIIADGPKPTASLIRRNIAQVSFSTVVSPVLPTPPAPSVKLHDALYLIKQMVFASPNPSKTNGIPLFLLRSASLTM